MKSDSIWKISPNVVCPPVNQDFSTDVLIVGGGITGMTTLRELKNANLQVTLVEKNICGFGVTSKSTAKITYLQDTIADVAALRGERVACEYIKSQIHATKLLTDIIADEHIACDLTPCPSYLFANTSPGLKKLMNIENLLDAANVSSTLTKEVPFNDPFIEAIKVEDTFVFHPLKFINALKMKFKSQIYEHSKLEAIEKKDDYYICHINNYQVKTRYVVLATHYPYFLVPYLFPLKTRIEVSYLSAFASKATTSFSAINLDKPLISKRTFTNEQKTYQLHLLNSFFTSDTGNVAEHFAELTSKEKPDYLWSNNDIITADHLPYVGSLKKDDKTFLMATGFNTWGMTNSTLAGQIIANIIKGEDDEYMHLFDPHRHYVIGKLINYPASIAKSAKAYLISNRKNTNNRNVTYAEIDGQPVIIYKDREGVVHIVQNKCPHMKCGLVLNEEEGTWDCLCHGSRFDLDGHCIEGPSNCDIVFPNSTKKF